MQCGGAMRERIRAVRQKYRGNGLYKIYHLFRRDVLHGFKVYKKLIKKYGVDAAVLSTAWRGTGDYFICGLYLEAYLEKYNMEHYVFLVPDSGGERKITELFQVYQSHTVEIADINPIRMLDSFFAQEGLNIHYFHHGYQNPNNLSVSVSGISLTGHNGLHMVDFYLYFGFQLAEDAPKVLPQFEKDERKIDLWFEQNSLPQGKTVLISPYSTGLEEYGIPEEFWTNLAMALKSREYFPVTNCAGEEECIEGTIALNIPYRQIVPFLEKAGCFVGIRSGLCDVIAGADCKKIILHTYKAKWWIDGRSIPYTGLNNMGLCDDAIEFEYRNGEETDALLERVLENI